MKALKTICTLVLCLIFGNINAQDSQQCAHCNMIVKDAYHKASAGTNNNSYMFDAVECLVNYLKTHPKDDFNTLLVSNYKTAEFIDAKTATYLISEAIPSPMGANLSAFKSKNDAIKTQTEKDGALYTWDEILVKFQDSDFQHNGHNHHNHYRPDAHAPIGVMRDHLHPKGGLMVSVRYMNMAMEGNKSGTDNIDDSDIYNDFMVAPQNMTMDMFMFGVMYAPSDKLTLMAMQNIVKKDMNLTAQMMMNDMTMMRDFSTSSSGFGDLKLGALYGLHSNEKTSLHLNVGLNIPTGDLEQRDDTPMMDNAKLPYTMQLGSGTLDISLGATYKENYTNTSWGTQFMSTFRTGENSQDYSFGNLYQLNLWGSYRLSNNFSVSARFLGISEGEISGSDSDLNPMMVTTANTSNYGGEKIKSFIGLNIAFPETSSLKDFRIGIEAGAPIYESYNGIQMNENLSINFGLKYNIL